MNNETIPKQQPKRDWRDPRDPAVWLLALLTVAVGVLPFVFLTNHSPIIAILTILAIGAGNWLSRKLKAEAND